MKLIKPSFEIIEQKPGLEGIYEMIEMAGRTCYKSERKEGTTAKDFVDRMIASGHEAMLEHGTVYLYFKENCYNSSDIYFIYKYAHEPYSKVVGIGMDYTRREIGGDAHEYTYYAITTNYRVLVENDWLDDLKYLCEPTECHEKRHTVRFITDIGVGRELTRHRTMSFAQESTRYCNYNSDRFNKEITFIHNNDNINAGQLDLYSRIEECYKGLLALGKSPQMARAVLPLATKSELIMTGFESDWAKVFDLRVKGTTGKPHPDMVAIMEPVMNEFINRGWYN